MDLDLSRAPLGITAVLELAGWPERRMGLVCKPAGVSAAESALRSLNEDQAVMAGLWLYCGRFEESHSIAQDIHAVEGSYWHGILHRQEPDDFNAGYWFKRVGNHPIFEDLRSSAEAAGYTAGEKWDPLSFIDFCSKARSAGGEREQIALEVQHIEFGLLLSWCIEHGRMK